MALDETREEKAEEEVPSTVESAAETAVENTVPDNAQEEPVEAAEEAMAESPLEENDSAEAAEPEGETIAFDAAEEGAVADDAEIDVEMDEEPVLADGEGDLKPAKYGAEALSSAGESVNAASTAVAEGPTLKTPVWVVIAIAALVVGLLIGMFVLNGGSASGGSLGGKTAVAEADLDKAIASYTYKGKTKDLSIREVIMQQSALSAAKNAEGNYTIPSADSALSAARNAIIIAAAEEKGVTVTDEEVAAYAETALGSSDFESIGSSYGMDGETVKSLLKNSCIMNKLRESIVGTESAAVAPTAPPEPSSLQGAGTDESSSGEESSSSSSSDANVVSKVYADYIIDLAGSEWDESKGTWASTDGPYATALASYEVTADGATYDAATTAYYVAYQLYSENASSTGAAWTDFVNGVLSNSTISIYTLAA